MAKINQGKERVELTRIVTGLEERTRLVALFLAAEGSAASRILDAIDIAAATDDETATETHERLQELAARLKRGAI